MTGKILPRQAHFGLDKRRKYRTICYMSYKAVTLSAVTGAMALLAAGSALAAGDQPSSAPATLQAAPQTASIDPGSAQTSPSSPIANTVNLSLDAFREAATTPVDNNAGSLTPPAAGPTGFESPKGARFVPLVRDDAQSLDTNNKTSAVQRSEFGVQLKSDF